MPDGDTKLKAGSDDPRAWLANEASFADDGRPLVQRLKMRTSKR